MNTLLYVAALVGSAEAFTAPVSQLANKVAPVVAAGVLAAGVAPV